MGDDDIKKFVDKIEEFGVEFNLMPEYLDTLQQALDKGYIDLSEDWLGLPSLYADRGSTENLMYVIFALNVLTNDNQLDKYYPVPNNCPEKFKTEIIGIRDNLKTNLLPKENGNFVKETNEFKQNLTLADRQYKRLINKLNKQAPPKEAKTIYKYKDGKYEDEDGGEVVVKEVNR